VHDFSLSGRHELFGWKNVMTLRDSWCDQSAVKSDRINFVTEKLEADSPSSAVADKTSTTSRAHESASGEIHVVASVQHID